MPTTERMIRNCGGRIELPADWGRSRRKPTLSDDEVRLIRSGTPDLDHDYASRFGLSWLTIRQVRCRKRYASVPDLPKDCA